MADMFKQYQGGIAPIQGISEAGARIGHMTQEGLMTFGKSLAEGIKAYQDNTQKRQVVDEQSKALGAQLQRYHQMFSQADESGNLLNPEYAGLAEGLQSQIEALSKVPSMSLGSALGAVNAAQAAFQGLDKELAVNEMMRKATLEKGIYAAEQNAPDKEKYDVPALMQSGKWGYNPNMSYAQNEVALRDFVKKAKEADPSIKGDVNEVVSKWRSQVQGLAAGIKDEQQKAMILDEIEAARRLDQRQKDVVSEYEKSGLAAGVMKFAGMYGEDLTKDMSLTTETTQALLDAKNKPEAVENKQELTKEQYQAKADALLEKHKKDGKDDSYVDYLVAFYKANPESIKSKAEEKQFKSRDKSANLARQKALKIIEQEQSGQKGLIEEVAEEKQKEQQANKTSIEKRISALEKLKTDLFLPNTPKTDVLKTLLERFADKTVEGFSASNTEPSYPIPTIGSPYLAAAKGFMAGVRGISGIKNATQDIEEVLDSSKLNLLGPDTFNGGKLTGTQRAAGLNAIDKKISELRSSLAETTKTPEQLKAEATSVVEQKQPAKPIDALVGTENLQFGTKEMTRDIPVAQKRAQVADYFKTKFGYVPSGFNEVYAKIHPESVLQTTQVGGVNLLWDGQKWTQLQGEKQLSVDEQLKLRSRQFGALDKEGKPVKTEIIPNSGIYAYGTFNSASTKRVDDFRQYVSDVHQVNYALTKLTEINQKFGSSTSPMARQAAEQWKTRLRAIIKPEVANTGSVSDFEQRKMETVIPAVAEFLSLQDTNQEAIDILREKMNMNVKSTGATFGIDIDIRTGANSKEAVIRQAKLDKHRNKQ